MKQYIQKVLERWHAMICVMIPSKRVIANKFFLCYEIIYKMIVDGC